MKIFYDIELYQNYFLALFKFEGVGGKTVWFEENQIQMARFICEQNKAGNTFVSFNGAKFDVIILNGKLKGLSNQKLKLIVDEIITGTKPVWQVARSHGVSTEAPFDHIDIIEIPAGQCSLKIYGARLHAPKLQDLPIKPDALISDAQKPPMRRYCLNDVETTELLAAALKSQIELRESMSAQYGVDLRSKSDAQIAEAVISSEIQQMTGRELRKPKLEKNKTCRYTVPNFISFKTDEFNALLSDIEKCVMRVSEAGKLLMPPELEGRKVKLGLSEYALGIGGIHSCEKSRYFVSDDERELIDADVTSYYPRIILGQSLAPSHIGNDFLTIYESIVARRVEAKAKKMKVVDGTLKIVINGSFGKFGSPYSALYSPELMTQVTITGQLSLLMLIEELELNGIPVVSANTDGVVSHVPRQLIPKYHQILAMWELTTGFDLELTHYRALYSESVNAYIAVKNNGDTKGKGVYADESLSKNPKSRICIDAVSKLLVDNTPIEETIKSCRDIRKFFVVRAVTGGAVKDDLEIGKTVRWYYSNSTTTPIVYAKNGNKVPDSEGATPMMQIADTFPDDLDFDRYVAIANKMLQNLGVIPKAETIKRTRRKVAPDEQGTLL